MSVSSNGISISGRVEFSPVLLPLVEWNPLDMYPGGFTITGSGLVATATNGLAANHAIRATESRSTGKRTFALRPSSNSNTLSIGFSNSAFNLNTALGSTSISCGCPAGNAVITASGATAVGATIGIATNKWILFLLDLDAGKAWVNNEINNTWVGGGDPSTGSTPTFTFPANTAMFPTTSVTGTNAYVITMNSGQSAYANTITIPPGFLLYW